MQIKEPQKKYLKMAILIVNGTFNYKNHLWLQLSIDNIIRYTSPYTGYKIFVWNHDYGNAHVASYLNSVASHVEVITRNDLDPDKWSVAKCDDTNTRSDCFGGGYHSHRGALQLLYEYINGFYEADVVFTFDSDAWPIRNNWELPLIYRLDRDIKLAGIWRDELSVVIAPYVHPSCLGIKSETIRRFNLRFDVEPEAFKEDTLSHFTRIIQERLGDNTILRIRRSNVKEYHSVFNGVYGGILYHHHLGTRYMEGNIKEAKTYGWQERNESPEYNKFILDGVTQRVFEQTDDFIIELAYGEKAFDYKLYSAFLKNFSGRAAHLRLLDEARKFQSKDLSKAYYILGLISKELAFDADFLRLYADVSWSLGHRSESACYLSLINQEPLPVRSENVAKSPEYGSEQEALGLGYASGDSHYRAYVGPPQEYDLIGAMTFNLLTTIGLRQHHHLLDIGCGSLRSGRLFITYLNPSHYTGIDPNEWLVNEGIRWETGSDLIRLKKPRFFFADNPGVLPEDMTFDFAVAQSVFSHGTLEFIELWLAGLFPHISPAGALLATFRSGNYDFYHEKGITEQDYKARGWLYPKCPTYRIGTIEEVAKRCGYGFKVLDWKHPRQVWAVFSRENYDPWFGHRQLTWNAMIEQLYNR